MAVYLNTESCGETWFQCYAANHEGVENWD